MKRILASIACLLTLAACNKDTAEPQLEKKLSVTPTSLTFSAEDTATQQITVTTENTDWTYSANYQWIKLPAKAIR